MAFQPGVAPQTQAHGSRLLADVAIEIAKLHRRSGEPIVELSLPASSSPGLLYSSERTIREKEVSKSNVLQGWICVMGSCGWVGNGASSPAYNWSSAPLLLLVIFRLTNGFCEFQRHNDMRDAGDLLERKSIDGRSDTS
ncbi:hypothetical protein IG631_13059 [Alternaria alternata]|nr:hypothetical protein IG631_13059 [Alternaria alternata]